MRVAVTSPVVRSVAEGVQLLVSATKAGFILIAEMRRGGEGGALLINLVCQSHSHQIIKKFKYTDVIVQVVNAKYLSMFKLFGGFTLPVR